jgi:hypothetical protein
MKATHEAYPPHTYSNYPRTDPYPFHIADTVDLPFQLSPFQYLNFGQTAQPWL